MVQNRTIRISPADKGGAIVVQDYMQYQEEAYRQLDNTDQYERLPSDPTSEIAKTSNELLHQLHNRNIVDQKCLEWGRIDEKTARTHIFYHLPKVHKNREKPPGRPIVSGVGGPTEKLSKLVDHWLQPLVQGLPSYLKDSTHLLQTLQEWKMSLGTIHEEILIVTIDVVALYPSIPHEDVTVSLREMTGDNEHLLPETPPISTLLQVVEHVLQNNVFEYDGEIFKQIQGTAMVTPMAPSIANIFMGWLERRLLTTSPWRVEKELWKRV
ncbi:hypothetical protein ACOMHN_037676 [Nucella lapillus]